MTGTPGMGRIMIQDFSGSTVAMEAKYAITTPLAPTKGLVAASQGLSLSAVARAPQAVKERK